MNKEEFFVLVNATLELDSHEISGDDRLDNKELIDSLAILGLMAMLDAKFNIEISTDRLLNIESFDALYRYVSNGK